MDIDELKTAFDDYNAEVGRIAAEQKKTAAAVASLQTMLARIPGNGKFKAIDDSTDAIAAEHKAFGSFVKSGSTEEFKALGTDVDPAAGYLTGTEFSRMINQKVHDASPIRRLARVITSSAAVDWVEPVDFSDLGANWVTERASRSETTNPEVGELKIPLREVYALQTVTQKLLDLSFVDIGSWIQGKIADKFARTEGLAFVSGDGVSAPAGFMTYPTDAASDATRALWTLQHVKSGHATLVTADGLRDVYWALRAPYRANSSWIMNSATANAIDKLKDGNGDYLWRNGQTAGAPSSLLGRPVEFDENMPAIGAGLNPIAFGDFTKGYTITEWNGLKPMQDPYTDRPNVIFYAYKRVGGGVSNSEAIKLLKIEA